MKNLKLVIAVREKKKRSRVQPSYERGEEVIRDRIKHKSFPTTPTSVCLFLTNMQSTNFAL